MLVMCHITEHAESSCSFVIIWLDRMINISIVSSCMHTMSLKTLTTPDLVFFNYIQLTSDWLRSHDFACIDYSDYASLYYKT